MSTATNRIPYVRLRYVIGLLVVALFCGTFLLVWHNKNTDFALATYLKIATKQLHSDANLVMQAGRVIIEPVPGRDTDMARRDFSDLTKELTASLAAMEEKWAALPACSSI